MKNTFKKLYIFTLQYCPINSKTEVQRSHKTTLIQILEKFLKKKQRKVLTKATESIMYNLRTIKTIKDYKKITS